MKVSLRPGGTGKLIAVQTLGKYQILAQKFSRSLCARLSGRELRERAITEAARAWRTTCSLSPLALHKHKTNRTRTRIRTRSISNLRSHKKTSHISEWSACVRSPSLVAGLSA